jgi:hypothetical protein
MSLETESHIPVPGLNRRTLPLPRSTVFEDVAALVGGVSLDDVIGACHVVGDEDEYTIVLDAEEPNLGWKDGHCSTPVFHGVVTDKKSLCPPLMIKLVPSDGHVTPKCVVRKIGAVENSRGAI